MTTLKNFDYGNCNCPIQKSFQHDVHKVKIGNSQIHVFAAYFWTYILFSFLQSALICRSECNRDGIVRRRGNKTSLPYNPTIYFNVCASQKHYRMASSGLICLHIYPSWCIRNYSYLVQGYWQISYSPGKSCASNVR